MYKIIKTLLSLQQKIIVRKLILFKDEKGHYFYYYDHADFTSS